MTVTELLETVRRVELRTNHLVNELAGERARPGRSQRRPRRWYGHVDDYRTFQVVIARRVRREGAPNHSRGGCAPHFRVTTNFLILH